MRVTSFGSGSCGNSFLVQSGRTHLLVDAGVAIRQLRAGLLALGVDGDLSAIVLSHEHHDHVSALPQVLRDHCCPILGTEGTLACIDASPSWSWERLTPHRPVEIGDLRVRPIPVPHDAAEPVGFVVEDHECRVAIFTDLGHVPDGLDVVIQGADLVVLEANYDERMLASGRYPAHLKRRIRGPHGHLSNDACGAFLARTLTPSTTDVWLAHLSHNNNRPAVALGAVTAHLSSLPVRCAVTPLPRRGATTTWDSRVARERPRQLTLGIQP